MVEKTTPEIKMPEQGNNASNVTNEEKILGAISYVSVACLLPLAMKPKSAFCQFHGKQGLVLFIVSIVVLLFLAAIPAIGFLLFLAYFALAVIAAFRAYNGEMWKIPVISMLSGKVDLNKIPTIGANMVAPKSEVKPEEEPKEKTEPEKKEEDDDSKKKKK